ncbi:retrovirus-related pol polyprotein from transposon TNT 1-94 [Tanacetum coccineum]
MGKSKKKHHKSKSEDTNQVKLYLLHMDLCGPIRVASVNGKKYILVIVDDYSRFTWVKCLNSKDKAPDFIIKFLKMIQVRLKAPVRQIRTNNGTEFQNDVVERRNRTLIKAARTMLIYAKALLFLWAEAVATTCYTQNRSIIRLRYDKTPYELLHDKLPDLSFFHVFGAFCYLTNNSENLGKLQPKSDTDFDDSEHSSSEPALHEMTPATISSGLIPNPPPSTPFAPPLRTDQDILFQPLFDELVNLPPSVDQPALEVIAPIAEVVAPKPAESTGSPSSTTIDQDAPYASNLQTLPETQSLVISNDVEEENRDLDVAHMNNDPFFGIPILENDSEASYSSDRSWNLWGSKTMTERSMVRIVQCQMLGAIVATPRGTTQVVVTRGASNDCVSDCASGRYEVRELLSNDSPPLPKNESFSLDHFDDPSLSRPPSEPPDVEICFNFEPDAGVVTKKVVGDISEHDVLMPNLLPTQPNPYVHV